MGSQTIYHLSSLPPPPSISEPGSNSLDDILKAPGECEYNPLLFFAREAFISGNLPYLSKKVIVMISYKGKYEDGVCQFIT